MTNATKSKTSPTSGQIQIQYSPQPYQRQIHDSQARYRVIVIGRRGGKSVFAINELIKCAVQKPGLYWFVAPTYKQAKQIAWIIFKKFLSVDALWKINEVDLTLFHPVINTRIELKGADKEDSLRGVGLNGVILDEAATVKSTVWPEVIRPMLIDTGGFAVFIGTPKRKNWFYDIYNDSLVKPDWARWQYPTAINQFVRPDEIETLKKELPQAVFRQEILAEFLDDETGVFRNFKACIKGELSEPQVGHTYCGGIDLAKTEDFSVVIIFDAVSRETVFFDRFQNISWPEQKERILLAIKRYNNAAMVLDSTGIGDAIHDDLIQHEVSILPFKFTNQTKKSLVERLQVALEQRLISFPNIPELVSELQDFEYQLTPTGKVTYNAPEGKHDDCVIALGLAVWGIRYDIYEKPEPIEEKDFEQHAYQLADPFVIHEPKPSFDIGIIE